MMIEGVQRMMTHPGFTFVLSVESSVGKSWGVEDKRSVERSRGTRTDQSPAPNELPNTSVLRRILPRERSTTDDQIVRSPRSNKQRKAHEWERCRTSRKGGRTPRAGPRRARPRRGSASTAARRRPAPGRACAARGAARPRTAGRRCSSSTTRTRITRRERGTGRPAGRRGGEFPGGEGGADDHPE